MQAQGEKIVVLTTKEGVDLEALADKASQLLLPSYLVSPHCHYKAPKFGIQGLVDK